MGLELKGAAFAYLPGTPMASQILTGISLELKQGEIVCLMGETGAGKSTLLQLMCGLLRPTAGEVLLEGRPVLPSREGGLSLRRAVGILLQSSEEQLFAETVRRDVGFGPRNLGLPAGEVERRVLSALVAVGMDAGEFGGRSPFSLSEGEMRRVAMAGVLALQPRYLLLDEPSSGLDQPGREYLHRTLRKLRGDGIGIMLVTHDWDEVDSMADRVMILAGGRIRQYERKIEAFTSLEELGAAGLRPPLMSEVLAEAKAKGLEVPAYASSPMEVAELVSAAMRAVGK